MVLVSTQLDLKIVGQFETPVWCILPKPPFSPAGEGSSAKALQRSTRAPSLRRKGGFESVEPPPRRIQTQPLPDAHSPCTIGQWFRGHIFPRKSLTSSLRGLA